MRESQTVIDFKVNLESFKDKSVKLNYETEQYWNVSEEVLSRIEGPSYLENKIKHNEFLKDNPFVARKKFINMYTTGKYSN